MTRNKSDDRIVSHVESLRSEMYADSRSISITDLGAGSLRMKEKERKVRDIAIAASLPLKQARLLARLVQGLGYRVQGDQLRAQSSGHRVGGIILELGTSLGISTLALALAAPERRVVTVEGCPALAQIATANLTRHGAPNATVLNMEFSEALEKIRSDGEKVSFAFIDGNHKGNALADYARKIAEMGEEMIIIADDIRLTHDMYSGWKTIVREQLAPAAMETLRFGILFFIKGITPGLYRIRC
ncbi:MAG: class I SAM-dependent methyltransferase [Bacteroidales bacterium]|nr:class I SAM-dependent methyltransferase [Bacteroidales bacterium]